MTLNEFLEVCEDIKEGWMLASLTNEYVVDTWPSSATEGLDENKLLELRVFNKDCEHKLFRPSINQSFIERQISDDENDKDYYDEVQYLDIDTSKGMTDGKVIATTGGVYKSPVQNIDNARVRIRYYLGKYEKTGQARVEDWRVVEFL